MLIPVEPREASLAHIKERLKAIKAKIEAAIPGIAIREVPNKLICTHNGHFVKVEVNDVKRGIIAPPIELPLCDLAQEDFGVFCRARIVPLSQLYGGKITAALDRQHPRDLFDVSLMLDYIKDFDQIKRGFIFCLLGSDRPILESLNPNFNDQRDALTNQFEGMSSTPFTDRSILDAPGQQQGTSSQRHGRTVHISSHLHLFLPNGPPISQRTTGWFW